MTCPTPAARLEHVNITVSDPERSARFFSDLCGWHERWRGPAINHGWTIHLGSDTAYLALYTPGKPQDAPFTKGMPLNHVGLLVDDLDRAKRVVRNAGFEVWGEADYAPGHRFYFLDWDGIEFEVVSYSEIPALPTT